MSKALKFYEKKFYVTGTGKFPYEMLAHDRACPVTEADAKQMQAAGTRIVKLVSRAAADGYPTKDRWASFGWKAEEYVG